MRKYLQMYGRRSYLLMDEAGYLLQAYGVFTVVGVFLIFETFHIVRGI